MEGSIVSRLPGLPEAQYSWIHRNYVIVSNHVIVGTFEQRTHHLDPSTNEGVAGQKSRNDLRLLTLNGRAYEGQYLGNSEEHGHVAIGVSEHLTNLTLPIELDLFHFGTEKSNTFHGSREERQCWLASNQLGVRGITMEASMEVIPENLEHDIILRIVAVDGEPTTTNQEDLGGWETDYARILASPPTFSPWGEWACWRTTEGSFS